MEEKLQTLTKVQRNLEERLEEVESIVEQLNDASTQPTGGATTPAASTAEMKKLAAQITALEK
jgi:hypothetical protein